MDAINQILIHPLLFSKVCGKLQDPRGVLSDTIRGKAVHLVISYFPKGVQKNDRKLWGRKIYLKLSGAQNCSETKGGKSYLKQGAQN